MFYYGMISPPKQSIFPKCLRKCRPKIQSKTTHPPTHPIPIPHQEAHINHLGPRGTPSDSSLTDENNTMYEALVGQFLGSGPDRGRSPVEWGDFPSVRPFIRPFVHPPLWASQPGLRGGRTNGRTNERTNGKSPHSTGIRPLSGPLPCLPP